MVRGVRDPSHHPSFKQRDKPRGGATPMGKDQCLTWINVCRSALGRFLAWRSASSHSFLTWRDKCIEREGIEMEIKGSPTMTQKTAILLGKQYQVGKKLIKYDFVSCCYLKFK